MAGVIAHLSMADVIAMWQMLGHYGDLFQLRFWDVIQHQKAPSPIYDHHNITGHDTKDKDHNEKWHHLQIQMPKGGL